MSKEFKKKPLFIILTSIIFFGVTACVFFTLNVLIYDGTNSAYSHNWNIKYSLVQAIIPTLVLIGFVIFNRKTKKPNHNK